jgi:ABC-type nitrate/sulfonate/bicarbonate transport system permease component
VLRGFRMGELADKVLWSLAGIAGFLIVWTVASLRMGNAVLLPAPDDVLSGFISLIRDGTLLPDVAASLKRVLAGFAIASSVAVPLAIVMALVRPVRLLLSPVVTFLRPIPPIAWIPIAIMWFGIGDAPSFFITAVAAFFPIFMNSYAGAHAVRPEHVHAARSLGAGQRALFMRIYLPSAMPLIATGLRIGLGQSWMAVVTAELIAAHSGLGYMIQANRLALETASVLVGMCVIGLLGAAMSAGLEYFERTVLIPWRVQ